MKMLEKFVLSGCLCVLASYAWAKPLPGVVGTFRAEVGKSEFSLSMRGCGKTVTKAFGHTITFYDDATFFQTIDLDGDTVGDILTTGLWEQPREGEIHMLYHGDISQGTVGVEAWGEIFRVYEARLREQCSDISANLLPATVDVKKLSMKLNKKRNQASMTSDIAAYAKGVGVGTGKFSGKITASGTWSE